MTWAVLKWTLPSLVALLAAAAMFTKKTFHVETIIPAPPETVWTVLMDTESYPIWNPVFVAVDGQYREGATVTNSVQFPDGSVVDMKAKILTLTDNRQLHQSGGVPGFLTFDHQWLLAPVEGGTRVTQHEVDRGIWLWFWDSDWIQPAYQKVLDALLERAVDQ